jgi:hypothetical protein
VGKDRGALGEQPATLQLFLKVVQIATPMYTHELYLQKAFDAIPSHVHRAAPLPSVA